MNGRPPGSCRAFARACAMAAAASWLFGADGAAGQDAPIATHHDAPAPPAASGAKPPSRSPVLEPDAFAWLRDPGAPDTVRWREQEAQQAQRWLAADTNHATLQREAAAVGADDPHLLAAAGRIFVGRSGAWRSSPLAAPAGREGRPEPALASPENHAPDGASSFICAPRPAGPCLIAVRNTGGLRLEGYDAVSGETRPDPFRPPRPVRSAVLDASGALLAVSREDGVDIVRRLFQGQDAAAAPVVFRAEPGETVVPGAAEGAGGVAVSWLTVTGTDGIPSLRIEADGEFRRLAAPAGSEIVGVTGDQLVVELRRGWSEASDLPPGALLGFDLAPLLKRAAELTPRRILQLTDAPDVRTAVATRSGLLLVVHEGAADVVYLCEPGLRGWAVRRLPALTGDALDIVAAAPADDAVVVRSRAFPDGERYFTVNTRTGQVDRPLPDTPLFPGRAVQAFQVTALDQSKVGYTLLTGGVAGAARRVLLLAAPRDAGEYAALRVIGSLWLDHGGDLAVAGRRSRRYDTADGALDLLLSYEDLSAIGRDLVVRGLAGAGRISLAGDRWSASVAAVDLARHPGQWDAAALIDPVTDPLRAPSAPDAWTQAYATAHDPGERATWRRLAAYDNLHAGAHYAPMLLVSTPTATRAFASDASRFAARLNDAGGAGLFVEAGDDAQAAALAVAFLLRLLG